MKGIKKIIGLVCMAAVMLTGCSELTKEVYEENSFINLAHELQVANLEDLLNKMDATEIETADMIKGIEMLLQKCEETDNYSGIYMTEILLAFSAVDGLTSIYVEPGFLTIAEYVPSEGDVLEAESVLERETFYQTIVMDATNAEVILDHLAEIEPNNLVSIVVLDETEKGRDFINKVLSNLSQEEENEWSAFNLIDIATNITGIPSDKIVSLDNRSELYWSDLLIRGKTVMVINGESSMVFSEEDLVQKANTVIALDAHGVLEMKEPTEEEAEDSLLDKELFSWLVRPERSKYGYNVVLERFVQESLKAYREQGAEQFFESLTAVPEFEMGINSEDYYKGYYLQDPDLVYLKYEIGKKVKYVHSVGEMTLDVAPIIIEGRTWLPARDVSEAFGVDPVWDSENKRVILKSDKIDLILCVEENKYVLNGLDVHTDEPSARIIDNRTLVPLRLVGEAFGAEVYYDSGVVEVIGYK